MFLVCGMVFAQAPAPTTPTIEALTPEEQNDIRVALSDQLAAEKESLAAQQRADQAKLIAQQAAQIAAETTGKIMLAHKCSPPECNVFDRMEKLKDKMVRVLRLERQPPATPPPTASH